MDTDLVDLVMYLPIMFTSQEIQRTNWTKINLNQSLFRKYQSDWYLCVRFFLGKYKIFLQNVFMLFLNHFKEPSSKSSLFYWPSSASCSQMWNMFSAFNRHINSCYSRHIHREIHDWKNKSSIGSCSRVQIEFTRLEVNGFVGKV